jgi:hypothetical protein
MNHRKIVTGIMAVIGVVSMALGIHFNLHFGLIIVGNTWLVGAVLMAWLK